MKVIVFGGKSYVGSMTQEFTGTKNYALELDAEPFPLDATPKYRDTQITYTSADPKVAAVNSRGMVTIKGIGSTTITVTSQKLGPLKSASFTVTITVTEPVTEPVTTVPVTEPETTAPVTEPETTAHVTEPPATEPETTVPETAMATEPEMTATEPPIELEATQDN